MLNAKELVMDDYSICKSYMSPDERELWSGVPQSGHLITPADAIMIPFSLFWCGFAFFWEYSAITGGASSLFAIFGLPLVAVGLYLVVGRFFHTAWIRKRTCYIITNRRIIRKRGSKIDFLDGSMTYNMQLHTFSDGCGTISFGLPTNYGKRNFAPPVSPPAGSGFFALENVEDVARVQRIISSMDK
ncbi:MAG: hypothetical protein J6L88_09010 [Clostridia bacterium]|nr:hypothetical protein [Clostridia bacterium]